MKSLRPLFLAGIMTAGVTTLAGYAYAGQDSLKTLILQLPGGSVQQIQYAGPTPPQIVMLPQAGMPMPMPVAFQTPVMPIAPAAGSPFAQIDQISAIMNAQAAAMMGAMNAMMAQGMPLAMPAAFGSLPPGGSTSYSFVSATSGGPRGACMESVQITAMGPGQAPKVVSRRAGDCVGGSLFGQRPAAALMPQAQPPASAVPAVMAPPAGAPAPRLIRAKAEMPVSMPQPFQS